MVAQSQTPYYILVGPEENGRQREIEAGRAPRLDYREVALRLHATVIEFGPPPTSLGGNKSVRVLKSLRTNFLAAIRLARHLPDNSVIYSTGETWGLPVSLALRFLRHPGRHVIYVHRVFSPTWTRLLSNLGSLLRVDGWICVTSYQAKLLRSTLGSTGGTVGTISQGVDTRFFDPERATSLPFTPYILAVGVEMRNYQLLFDAVRHLAVHVVIKASSAWMNTMRDEFLAVPDNVEIITQRMSYLELRDLYASASLVVAPLKDTPQAAGITTILEGMAMQKCVVATRSSGLPDVLVHDETGAIVEPSAVAFADTLAQLLTNPQQLGTLAHSGRHAITNTVAIEHHAQQVADFVIATSNRKVR